MSENYITLQTFTQQNVNKISSTNAEILVLYFVGKIARPINKHLYNLCNVVQTSKTFDRRCLHVLQNVLCLLRS